MSHTLKQLLLAILAVTIPFLYTLILNLAPDFPLPENTFVELIIWVIGSFIGGWKMKRLQQIMRGNQIFNGK